MFFPLYLANKPHETSKPHEVRDKYRGDVFARCSYADEKLLETALAAAHSAERAMALLSLRERVEILETISRALSERRPQIQELLCREVGKTRKEADGEISRAIETFHLAAVATTEPRGEYLDLSASARAGGTWAVIKHVPIGTTALITPFNFPLNLAAHKVAPAIAAGCPFVLKPPSSAPLSALALGEILSQTKLPAGAFSILPCPGALGEKLATDRRVRLVSFTGSASVGWKLKKAASEKKVVLELGGNAACLVDAGFPITTAVQRLVPAIFGMAGQSCISVQRVFIEKPVYGPMRDALVAETKKLHAGDPLEASTSVGPMISEEDAARVEDWVESAQGKGARVLCGGKRQGAVFEPTLLENVPTDHPLVGEEAFAPIACLEPVETFEDGLTRINQSRYGLQAGVLTRDIRRIQAAWDALEVGGVIAGDVPTWRADAMPYGGVKESGVGREGIRYAIEDFSEKRLLAFRPS